MNKHTLLTNLAIAITSLSALPLMAQRGRNLLPDPTFAQGLAIVEPINNQPEHFTDTVEFFVPGGLPQWNLIQWKTRYPFDNRKKKETKDKITYTNPSKLVSLTRSGELTLEIKSSKDYLHPRKPDEFWPHLLIEQNFLGGFIHMKDYKNLTMSFDMRLNYCKNRMSRATYNSGIHAGQTPFFFRIVNTNTLSKGYGNAVWLGVPSYDSRHDTIRTKREYQFDEGTGIYIYTASPMESFGNVDFNDHKWHTATVNVTAVLRDAITKLKSNGMFQNTEPEDMSIVSMNFGWEMPGTFDGSVSIRNPYLREE